MKVIGKVQVKFKIIWSRLGKARGRSDDGQVKVKSTVWHWWTWHWLILFYVSCIGWAKRGILRPCGVVPNGKVKQADAISFSHLNHLTNHSINYLPPQSLAVQSPSPPGLNPSLSHTLINWRRNCWCLLQKLSPLSEYSLPFKVYIQHLFINIRCLSAHHCCGCKEYK